MIRRFLLREGPLKLRELGLIVTFFGVFIAMSVLFLGMPVEVAVILGILWTMSLVLVQIEEIQKEIGRRKNTQHG